MSSAKKRGSAKNDRTRQETPLVRIFVRVGALKRFHTLKQKTAELPVVVSWDRRRVERRTLPGPSQEERRERDRRQRLPFTWEVADFVVIDEPTPSASAKKTKHHFDPDR